MKYIIELYNKKYIGDIQFVYVQDENKVYITNLYIIHKQRGKSYGRYLILLMLHKLQEFKYDIDCIEVDDYSDYNKTKESLYYKLGFRIDNKNNEEEMRLYICNNKEKRKTIRETFLKNKYKYYDNDNVKIKIFNSFKEYIFYNLLLIENKGQNINKNVKVHISQFIDENNMRELNKKNLYKFVMNKYKKI